MELPGKTKRGRPKRRFTDAVREDMAEVEVTEEDAEDRTKWRWNIRCADPGREKPNEEDVWLLTYQQSLPQQEDTRCLRRSAPSLSSYRRPRRT